MQIESVLLDTTLLSALIFFAALLYSSVGHGGASGYLAAMALFGLAPMEMKPAALTLNLFVASIASYKYIKAGYFSWKLCWPFVLASVPFAFLGGLVHLPSLYYKPLVGLVLLYSAGYLFWKSTNSLYEIKKPNYLFIAIAGMALGFLSGLVGVGGGIFLSPLLIMLRWESVKKVSGIAAVFILLNSAAGLSGFVHSAGLHLPDAMIYWVLAAIVGGYIGAEFGSKKFSTVFLKKLLAIVLLIAGTKMFLSV